MRNNSMFRVLTVVPMFRVMLLLAAFIAEGAINTQGQTGAIRTLSGKTFGRGSMNVMMGLSYQQDGGYVQNVLTTANVAPGSIEEARLISTNLSMGIGITNFWDFAASAPLYYDWSGFGLTDGGTGDVEISTKLQLPPYGEKKFIYQSYMMAVTLPVGMTNHGLFPRHAYYITKPPSDPNPAVNFYSSDYVTIKPLMLLTFDASQINKKVPLQIHLNLGGVFGQGGGDRQNTMIGNFAMEFSPAEFITLGVDLSGESRWSNFSTGYKLLNDPMWLSPEIRFNTPSGVYVVLGGDYSLSSKNPEDRFQWEREVYRYTTGVIPQYGAHFMFGWNGFLITQDRDKDGLLDNVDRCQSAAEDKDGFLDDDGCPDIDNDNDGIPDSLDKCKNQIEDLDGFLDTDGCPDPDNDGDGIPDLQDRCPSISEDFDGFEDSDGCSDFDNDKDGIVDSLDKCQNESEDKDAFNDDDGCPDPDNDKDGFCDAWVAQQRKDGHFASVCKGSDQCPNIPEIVNGYMDDDGCPDTVKQAVVKKEVNFPRQQIVHGCDFNATSGALLPKSYKPLEIITQALKENPEIDVEVRGHTHGLGVYEANMKTSQLRADAVRLYLISKGIDGQRIRAVGFGSSSPIGDNRTASGRTQNRRIEIVRIK